MDERSIRRERETGDGSLSAEDREPSPVSELPVEAQVPITGCADRKPSPVSQAHEPSPVSLRFMREALALAAEAGAEGEVPVGCVITLGDRIVGRGRNRREGAKNALCHAELEAIDQACRTLGGWRLWQCDMYVTLEPCPMCAGAIINARIPRLYYGAPDPKAGSCGTVTNLFALPFNHRPEVRSGILAEESAALLQDFFTRLRENRTKNTAWKQNRLDVEV